MQVHEWIRPDMVWKVPELIICIMTLAVYVHRVWIWRP